MANLVTKGWKTVNLSGNQAGFGGSGSGMASTQTNNWYNDLVRQSTNRHRNLDRYDQMDYVSIDISRALDMIAEDISSDGADDDTNFEIDFPDDVKVAKTRLRTLESTLRNWKQKRQLDEEFYDHVREAIKYGMVAFRRSSKRGGDLTKLKARGIVGHRVKQDDPTEVTHYIYDDGVVDDETKKGVKKKEYDVIPIEDLLILKVGEGPYGESVLARVYRVWKQLQLLEDAVVIYRIVRAPERRVFYIDTGRLPAAKSESYINKIRSRMDQMKAIKNNDIDTDYNPTSMQEDFFIGQSGEGRGSRVESLPGGDNLGQIQDIQYFNKKLALGLRIPPSYMDNAYKEGRDGAQTSDGRLGMAYMAELRYVGYIKRIQKKFASSLYTDYVLYAEKEEVEVPEDMIFRISPPQSFSEYRLNELNNALINTYASAEQMMTISKKFAAQKFLQLDATDIEENERMVLLEKGFGQEEIKKMEPEKVANIVYGDGRLDPNKEEGDGGGGFGRF